MPVGVPSLLGAGLISLLVSRPHKPTDTALKRVSRTFQLSGVLCVRLADHPSLIALIEPCISQTIGAPSPGRLPLRPAGRTQFTV